MDIYEAFRELNKLDETSKHIIKEAVDSKSICPKCGSRNVTFTNKTEESDPTEYFGDDITGEELRTEYFYKCNQCSCNYKDIIVEMHASEIINDRHDLTDIENLLSDFVEVYITTELLPVNQRVADAIYDLIGFEHEGTWIVNPFTVWNQTFDYDSACREFGKEKVDRTLRLAKEFYKEINMILDMEDLSMLKEAELQKIFDKIHSYK